MRLNFKTIGSIVATLLIVTVTTAIAQQCQPNMTGSWVSTDRVRFDLLQDWFPDPSGGYRVTGVANSTDGRCIDDVPITGYVAADGSYTGSADASRSKKPCANSWWDDYMMPAFLPGCQAQAGFYISEWSDPEHVDFSWHKPCDVPEGEITDVAQGWWEAVNVAEETTFHFPAHLQTAQELKFGGRLIEEAPSVNYVGWDTCFFEGSGILDMGTGDTMRGNGGHPVNSANYYEDQVGWLKVAVDRYRTTVNPATQQTQIPCGFVLYQTMWIHCDGGVNLPYWENVLTATIGADYVQSCRAGKCVTRPY